jgi:uncharacterized RDD family membrane protein YckC
VAQGPAPASWQPPIEELAGPAPGIRFAAHGPRLLAYLIDTIVLFAVIMLFVAVLGGVVFGAARVESFGLAAGGALLLFVIIVALAFLYFPFFWWRGGQTPGMRVFGLRVVRDRDGGPISGSQAALRLLGYWVNGVAFYIGFAWILIDQRRRGWHDLIAQTVVIEDPRR